MELRRSFAKNLLRNGEWYGQNCNDEISFMVSCKMGTRR